MIDKILLWLQCALGQGEIPGMLGSNANGLALADDGNPGNLNTEEAMRHHVADMPVGLMFATFFHQRECRRWREGADSGGSGSVTALPGNWEDLELLGGCGQGMGQEDDLS